MLSSILFDLLMFPEDTKLVLTPGFCKCYFFPPELSSAGPSHGWLSPFLSLAQRGHLGICLKLIPWSVHSILTLFYVSSRHVSLPGLTYLFSLSLIEGQLREDRDCICLVPEMLST